MDAIGDRKGGYKQAEVKTSISAEQEKKIDDLIAKRLAVGAKSGR